MQCATHPNVETHIRCSKCEKPICHRCMVQTPVGHRCAECAQVRRLPVLILTPVQALQALAAAVALAFAGGVAWGIVQRVGSFLLVVAAIGIGYAIGEGISRAANGKRAGSLPIMAGVSAAASFLIGNVLFYVFWTDAPLDFALKRVFEVTVWGALSAALAVAIAVNRLRS